MGSMPDARLLRAAVSARPGGSGWGASRLEEVHPHEASMAWGELRVKGTSVTIPKEVHPRMVGVVPLATLLKKALVSRLFRRPQYGGLSWLRELGPAKRLA